jgi:lysophospholipase L1-like esterase
MKKKTTMIFMTLLILIVGIGIAIREHQENTSLSPPNMKEAKENEENVYTQQEGNDNQTNEETKSPADYLSKEFLTTIQRTVHFFSGKNLRIVAIGDSLTQGVGDSTGQGGYVGILDTYINRDRKIATFENLGKRGNRTDQLLVRLDEPGISSSIQDADMILITIGANDIMKVLKENFMDITYKDFSDERVYYESRLREILSKINKQNPNASIYLIGFYNPFQQYFNHIKELDMIVDDWNNTSKKVAEEFDATFIPTKDLFINTNTNLFADDHFHPNDNGYQLIAERILNYLVIE